ncbi:alkyl sulfatase C-terminal domain-containing protein [Hamadaea sp. NPDC050747]|uniref:alkyl sulfatase C-terminal domain-containing protein n=1 Tax=Hamadaea sp. NPDC050747 TaxID=3155789 RepID=UPI00340D4C57
MLAAESGTWHNFYLVGAQGLRATASVPPSAISSAGTAAAVTVEQIFDSIAIRVDGPLATEEQFVVDWTITNLTQHSRMQLSDGALIHWANGYPTPPTPTRVSP